MKRDCQRIIGAVAVALSAGAFVPVFAQDVVVVQEANGSTAVQAVPADRPAPGAAPVAVGPDGKPIPGPPPGAAPGQPGQPAPPGGAPGSKPSQPDADKEKTVTRPDKPPLPPDPRELKVTPDPEGKIRFKFHGQPWADVLEWLAAVSGMSLDWQELPGDYLNLVTRRDYTIPEARDLINRHLLARGYTLLENGEILSVVKLDKINPGLVPRVEPDELESHLPHEYVKVSFPLDWILSEKAVEELKPMLSPSHKITPLKNTNRIEVMDSVVNLREIYDLIRREQSDEPQQRLVQEFPLAYTRATEVLEQLKSLLGIESKPASSAPMSRQQMEMMQQQQMMMMQQMQQAQQQGRPGPQQVKQQSINLVANTRRNSILAHAPPDKMEIIAQAVKAIDVETDQAHSLLTNANRMQVHRLHGIDPETLVKTLMEIGQLDPNTRLEADTKNRAIIAYASLTDHLTIRQVVERLDGSGRSFEVVSLRRLDAEYVAGTIEFMMAGPPEQKQQQSRFYFDYYSPFGRGNDENKSGDKFRVDADIENNRLLLWANEVELQEVTNLLVKLGEIPSRGGSDQKLRVLDAVAPDEMQQLLERLRDAWPNVSPNPLTLPPAPRESPTSESAPLNRFDSFERRDSRAQRETPRDGLLAMQTSLGARDDQGPSPALPPPSVPNAAPTPQVPQNAKPGSQPATESQDSTVREKPSAQESAALPPVSISISPDGRLVLSSQDPLALDLLEELIRQMAPPRRDYRIYRLKYADSFWVRKNLEDFFAEDDEKDSNRRNVYYYDSYSPPSSNDKPLSRLSRRKKLKFIDDLDTNSILVQGADAAQLRTIEDLIRTYDQQQQADASSARVSIVIPIQYSKALTIATAVKDVYRDLLSSNDRALASGNPEQKNRMPPGANTYIFNEGGNSGEESERTRVTFKGKLSIGVDEVTNTLLVSAEGENLARNVSEMIRSLDEAAKPLSSVTTVTLGANSNAARVQEVLSRLLAESKSAAPKNAQPKPQPGQSAGVVNEGTPGGNTPNPEGAVVSP